MKNKCDLILLDDDELIHLMWNFVATQKGLSLKAFKDFNVDDFEIIHWDTPLFIDVNLKNMSGINVAQDLFHLGFQNIYLASGYDLKAADVPKFIKGILGKDFPSESLLIR